MIELTDIEKEKIYLDYIDNLDLCKDKSLINTP